MLAVDRSILIRFEEADSGCPLRPTVSSQDHDRRVASRVWLPLSLSHSSQSVIPLPADTAPSLRPVVGIALADRR
ncbi:MAG: hypothetical protein A07HR60_01453 [uncultured archaeon A07HR60]|nr:MAG: hypothetical protein A07HR60_01453 [uncultured archaeon A07HR60]